MSFILDALERSRQERDAAAVPGMSPAMNHPGNPEGRSHALPALLLGLGLALAVIAWLLISRLDERDPGREQGATVAPSVASPLSTPSPLPVVSTLPRPEVQSAAKIPVVSDSADAVRDLYRAAQTADTAQVPADRRSDTPDIDAPDDDVGESVDIDAMVARAEAALDSLDLAAHPAPMLEALSQTLRDGIPTLMYSQHDYRSSGESAVFINRERHREGDSIDGVRVQEILPDSVILSYRGTEFRLRALNSWVNL